MTVNLIKLCVGVESLAHFRQLLADRPPVRDDGRRFHTTRMWPRREAELLDGGSLYWVIKGEVLCRQRIFAFEEAIGEDGIRRCRIVLEPELIPTRSAARRAFQGWRYFEPGDAPPDLPRKRKNDDELPPEIEAVLGDIGVT